MPGEPAVPLIADRTHSALGRAFALQFFLCWLNDTALQDAELEISDRPAPTGGLDVRITYQQQPVFQVTLSPARKQLITSYAREAAQKVADQVEQIRFGQLLPSSGT